MEHMELAPEQTVPIPPLSGPHCTDRLIHMLQVSVKNRKGHNRSRNAMAQKAPTLMSTLTQRKPEPLADPLVLERDAPPDPLCTDPLPESIPDPLDRPLPDCKPLLDDAGVEGHFPCSSPSSVNTGRTGKLTCDCEALDWNSTPRTAHSK